MADPFSLVTGIVGTLGVLAHSTKVLIELVGDVKEAPAEVSAASAGAIQLEQVLREIQNKVDSGQIPHDVLGTSDVLLSSCATAVGKLTVKLKPHIDSASTGRRWRSRMKWAMMDKKSVLEMVNLLEHNKTALSLALNTFSLSRSEQQADRLDTKLGAIEALTKDNNRTAVMAAASIQDGVANIAAEQKAQTDMLTLLVQQLQQQFVANQPRSSGMGSDNTATKTEQIRDLMAKVKDDPVYALRTFFEGSTIIESENTRVDVANLDSLEEDYIIADEPDDVGGEHVKSVEERIEDYGGIDNVNMTLLNAVIAGDKDVTIFLLEGYTEADIDTRNETRQTPLMLAAGDDQKQIVKILLDYDAKVNAYDESKLTALHMACVGGFHAMCEILIQGGADLEARSIEGDTPLRAAMNADRPHIVQLLIEHKCSPKGLGPNGESVLHLAVEKACSPHGSIALLRSALLGGLDPNLKDSKAGKSALHLAAEKGRCDCIELLLESKATVDVLDDNLDTPFMIAARAGRMEVVKQLAAGGAKVDLKTFGGLTALQEAAKTPKSSGMIQVLLDCGANLDARTSENFTPFLRAARWGNHDAIRLLSKSSDLKIASNQGSTAMHLVACFGTIETAKLLVEVGAELETRDSALRTPLHEAARYSNVKVLEYLLSHGLDIESLDEKGQTPLHYAASTGGQAVIEFLLDRNAKIDAYASKAGVCATPLLQCVFYDKVEDARLLLKNGSDVSVTGIQKYSALHICAWKGHVGMAEMLLRHGAAADLESLDQDVMTPLLRAAWNGKEDVAQLLIDHGANVQAKRPKGDNAFRIFCRCKLKSIDLFRQLAKVETDLNAKDENGCAPLLHLAANGLEDCVSVALEMGADVEVVNPSGLTSLNHAAKWGLRETAIALLDAGANIDHEINDTGVTPLLQAAAFGHISVIKVLIARGANLRCRNKAGQDALEVAFAAKQESVVALLSSLDTFASSSLPEAIKNGDVLALEVLLTKNPALLNQTSENKRTPLHDAIIYGTKLSIVELLLRKGADIDAQDAEGKTPLMTAACNNREDMTAKLLEKKPDKSLVATTDITPLHYASRWCASWNITKMLVEYGFPLEVAETEGGGTPLHVAASFGKLEIIRYLLEAGAKIDSRDNEQRTPLMRALRSNHVAVAKFLLEQGADVAAESDRFKMSPLTYAATWTKSIPVVEMLCDRGAVVDQFDSEHVTPLGRAALNGNEEGFSFLLEKGADLENKDIYGQTILHRVCRLGVVGPAIKILLQAKASINCREDRFGMTPLHYAAATDNNTSRTHHGEVTKGLKHFDEVVTDFGTIAIGQQLLESGADLDAKDISGATPLFKSMYQNKTNMLKFLAESGADKEIMDNEGFNVLHRAIRGKYTSQFEQLLTLGVDIHAKTTKLGLAPLHVAAIADAPAQMVKSLLAHGADIEGKDADGNTPLLRAAMNGSLGVLKALLADGAEKETANSNSLDTPLLQAIVMGQGTTAQHLIENGANLSAQSNWGFQAIHEAVRCSLKPIIKLLLDRGQIELEIDRPSSLNLHGFRPLHVAVRETWNADIIKMLCERGADLEARTHLQLKSPFLHITEPRVASPKKTVEEMLKMAQLLEAQGADVRATDKHGSNLLFSAASEQAVGLFEWLLEKGLDIESENIYGLTVLHMAAKAGNVETIKWLLGKGADPDHRSKRNRVPLHLAVTWGHVEAACILAEEHYGALDVRDDNNETPLDVARKAKNNRRKEDTVELRQKAARDATTIYDHLHRLKYPDI